MDTTTELVYLHETLARLCRLYSTLIKESDSADLIQKIRADIHDLYSEIMSITKKRAA